MVPGCALIDVHIMTRFIHTISGSCDSIPSPDPSGAIDNVDQANQGQSLTSSREVSVYVLFALVLLLQMGGFFVLFMRTSSIVRKLDFFSIAATSTTNTRIEAAKVYSSGGESRETSSSI